MAYFAHVIDGTVTAVHVIADAEAPNEATGAEFLAQLHGTDSGEWVQTFTDGTRGQQASVGDLWDGTEFTSPSIGPEEVCRASTSPWSMTTARRGAAYAA